LVLPDKIPATTAKLPDECAVVMIGSGTLPKQRGPKKIMAKTFFMMIPRGFIN
jgi:hypothetical protein